MNLTGETEMDMDFEQALTAHLEKHKSATVQDVVKFCYQAAKGAEHLLSDIDAARKYFMYEYEQVEPCDNELFEELSEEYCRVDMAAWKYAGREPEELFEMFVRSAGIVENGDAVLNEYLCRAKNIVLANRPEISEKDWDSFMKPYIEAGMPALHHSDIYREKEKPAYRLVRISAKKR